MTNPAQAFSQASLFRTCRGLLKEKKKDEAVRLLADALRRNRLDAEGVLHAGRVLGQSTDDEETDFRVVILGQCTTSWLAPALVAIARGRGVVLEVVEGDYDNVLQGLETLDRATDAIVFVPWTQRLLAPPIEDPGTRITEELGFWQSAWSMAAGLDARIVQVGFDFVDAGGAGQHVGGRSGGPVALVRALNDRIRAEMPGNAYFVDLEQVAGGLGRETFYDRRGYYWTKQPFSDEGVVRLAENLWAGLRASTSGPKKVLVLDLDNTLWGGVVGELGPLGIELGESAAGEAFRDFQRLAKELADCGTLLVACSKNNPDDAREPFETNPEMVLSLDDFAAFRASWAPKSEAISEIADELRLGLDSFVFFDDEPAEREMLRQALPEVEVVDVPDDPADYRQALLRGLWFESVNLSAEDRMRTSQYRAERERRTSRSRATSVDDYLRSLQMSGEIGAVDESSLPRVVQLIGKTNQFNLTTRRHTVDAVRDLVETPGTQALTLRLEDRFGDYGLVGVLIAVSDGDGNSGVLRIDTWLMSCRVIGRTAEQFFFNGLLDRAIDAGESTIVGEYIPSRKNAVVADLYERLGFTAAGHDSAGTATFELALAKAKPARTLVDAESDRK